MNRFLSITEKRWATVGMFLVADIAIFTRSHFWIAAAGLIFSMTCAALLRKSPEQCQQEETAQRPEIPKDLPLMIEGQLE